MAVDPRYLRDHYASLSNGALRAIHRSELVETAQKCYDDEVRRRKLASRADQSGDLADSNVEVDEEPSPAGDEPDWLADASEVLSRADQPGTAPATDLEQARDALETAGIPCYLDLSEIHEEQNASPPPTHIWRLMVPGNLNLRAMSSANWIWRGGCAEKIFPNVKGWSANASGRLKLARFNILNACASAVRCTLRAKMLRPASQWSGAKSNRRTSNTTTPLTP